jgi:hypothetical protein
MLPSERNALINEIDAAKRAADAPPEIASGAAG